MGRRYTRPVTLDPSREPAGRWAGGGLPGVIRTHLERHEDERGSFTELWRASWLEGVAGAPFVQANLSRSRGGVLRGLHVHRRQADLWVVVEGSSLVALVDLREAATGTARPRSATLELRRDDALFIPPLVAHGFLARSDLILAYLVTSEFDGSDEYGFAWDDADAGVAWPAGDPILSERDRTAPTLGVVLERLRTDQAGQSDGA
jgi:dTDP-4-dehydrorhamnose 3,5-epimerase